MDMNLVLLIAVGLLACGMVAGHFQTAPVAVRRRRNRQTRPIEQ
ncbi:MAG: hypothetical protein OEV99_13830 [Nitrospira sp.]|nr:hypothetical protein [Nitrospira sp.]MDH4370904.1 hypothetical protein [Nitrospira sp.]MDH5498692.1 hypothetical protein [Nitrospira sp.]MDH5725710.1 hypothetical protein [Nitrospira sp.]